MNIYLKLNDYDSWVLSEILSRFESEDDSLQDKAIQLYARLIELRSEDYGKLDKEDAF
jgi:hypothetical protein